MLLNKFLVSNVNNWVGFIVLILSLLMTIAFFTLSERKFMGAIQRRKGPDVVGFLGLLQAIADGVKLIFKELLLPYKISLVLFLIGPSLVFFLSLCGWVVLPFSDVTFSSVINSAVLFVFVTSGFNIYGLVLSGWSSNSRYAFLGGIRATAQMISYELIFGMVNLFIFFLAGSFNFTDIVIAQTKIWFIIPLFPIFIIYLIVMLAETNRTPFDLAEAEAELVAGYNVEYSSMTFALFFLGEYANMIFLSVLGTIYFLGGWSFPYFSFSISGLSELFFICKILLFCMFFIWIRATLPRYRYDQLMELAWKVLLPFLFGFFLLLISFFFFWKQLFFFFFVFLVLFINLVLLCISILSSDSSFFFVFEVVDVTKTSIYEWVIKGVIEKILLKHSQQDQVFSVFDFGYREKLLKLDRFSSIYDWVITNVKLDIIKKANNNIYLPKTSKTFYNYDLFSKSINNTFPNLAKKINLNPLFTINKIYQEFEVKAYSQLTERIKYFFINQTPFLRNISEPVNSDKDSVDFFEWFSKLNKPFFMLIKSAYTSFKLNYTDFDLYHKKMDRTLRILELVEDNIDNLQLEVERLGLDLRDKKTKRAFLALRQNFTVELLFQYPKIMNALLLQMYPEGPVNISYEVLVHSLFFKKHASSHLELLYVKYCTLENGLELSEIAKTNLRLDFVYLLLSPLLAPFIFLKDIYEISYIQAAQLFPYDLYKQEFGHFMTNQALVNAKYI